MQTLDNTRENQVTVEAETVEAALAEISTQLGADAEIMRAQKVHRGGVGGFFAKEMVQLTARRRRDSASSRSRPAGGGISQVLERMAQDADAGDGDFRTALRRELSSEPVESGSEGFLTAVGWTADVEEPLEELETPASVELNVDVDGHDVPALADQTEVVEDPVPTPVVVGPVMNVAPVFPDVDDEPTIVEVQQVEIVEATVTEPPAPVAGPVVPIDFPGESDFDEAAEVDTGEPEMARPSVVKIETLDAEPDVDEWRVAVVEDAPEGMGPVDWGTTALLRLGMPAPVISAVADLDPTDDLSWIDGIAAAVAPFCGPLPTGDVIVVGPHAERLAEPLGLPLIHSGDMAPYAGSFCAMVEDSARDRTWLEFVQGGRGIHLVIGDEPWQDLLIGEPVAVSWVGESCVSDALYLALTLGATLGYGTVDGFVSSMVRAQPTDVALAVRRIVGRR